MKSYPYSVKNADICNRRSKSTYFGKLNYLGILPLYFKCRRSLFQALLCQMSKSDDKYCLEYIQCHFTQKNTSSKICHRFLYQDGFFLYFSTKKYYSPSIFSLENLSLLTDAGAQSTAYGIVTLLGLAWVLGRVDLTQLLISNKDDKDILFLFLNGENWNYYGRFELTKMLAEKRFPYAVEMSSKEANLHPIEPEHIDILINIDQLGINGKTTYILHDNDHPFLDSFK